MQSPEDLVRLVLHHQPSKVSIGEPIRPELQIVNDTDSGFEFPGFVFDMQDLAFAEPAAVRLIAPDGRDLALPYQRDSDFFRGATPLTVAPHQQEWQYLPLQVHFHLRDPGQYVFQLKLFDDQGRSYSTEEMPFELADVPSSVPPGSLDLALEPAEVLAAGSEPISVDAVFRNRTNQPLIILTPQQDSFDGWANPVYQFAVMDGSGRILPTALRSGTMAEPHYDSSTQLVIAPDSEGRVTLALPDLPGLRSPGQYRVALTYLVRDQAIGKSGTVLERPMVWDAGTFTGRLESNIIQLTVR